MKGDAIAPRGFQHTRKRRRSAQVEVPSKCPRLRERAIKPHYDTEGEVHTQLRRSPRLQEIANQRQVKHIVGRDIGPEPEPSSTKLRPHNNLKRRRNIKDENGSNCNVKRPKRKNPTAGIDHSKDDSVKAWLDTSCSKRGELDLVATDNMPLPSPDDTVSASFTSSKSSKSSKSDKASISPYDGDYREALGYRDIYISRERPSSSLMQRAREIITKSRSTPEVDEATAEGVKETTRELENEGEEDIIQQLALSVILAMSKVPDQRLASSAGLQWNHFVPIPLKRSILINPLPLARPKPDKVIGYSKKAFTENQLATIDLLTDLFGRKYGVVNKLYFPFIDFEFKAQAKGGSHYVATNQAACAGAVASNGFLELVRRGSGLPTHDHNEPQFFSLSMDHEYIRINVHWLNLNCEENRCSFHVESLSKHFFDDADGLRAVQRTVKNILDWGLVGRLELICKQLDAYRKKVERAAAKVPQSTSISTAESQKEKGRKRKTIATTSDRPEDSERAPPKS